MEPCNQIERIAQIEQRGASNTHRLDAHDNKIDKIEATQTQILLDLTGNMREMTGNIKLLTQQQEAASRDINGIKDDVRELKEKPGKRWDTATVAIITTIIGSVIGFVISKL